MHSNFNSVNYQHVLSTHNLFGIVQFHDLEQSKTDQCKHRARGLITQYIVFSLYAMLLVGWADFAVKEQSDHIFAMQMWLNIVGGIYFLKCVLCLTIVCRVYNRPKILLQPQHLSCSYKCFWLLQGLLQVCFISVVFVDVLAYFLGAFDIEYLPYSSFQNETVLIGIVRLSQIMSLFLLARMVISRRKESMTKRKLVRISKGMTEKPRILWADLILN